MTSDTDPEQSAHRADSAAEPTHADSESASHPDTVTTESAGAVSTGSPHLESGTAAGAPGTQAGAATEPARDPSDGEDSTSDPDRKADDAAPADTDSGPHLHPALIATAVALPVALIVAVLVIAVMSRQSVNREPLALSAIDAPAGNSQDCVTLLAALPSSLGEDYTSSEFAQPAPPATAAWQLPDGGDPIVLRCGLQRPQEFNQASALQVVNGVNWFEVRDQTTGVTSGTWYAVDRGTYIAVTMPNKAGPSPLQEISNTIVAKLPAKPLDPGPVPN